MNSSLYLQSVQALVNQSFNGQILVSDRVDIQSEPIYDAISIPAAGSVSAATAAFFAVPLNSGGKTLADTNLTESGKLASPEAFSIFSFRLKVSEGVFIGDALNVSNGFAYVFSIISKAYQTGPIWQYNAGAGLFVSSVYPAAAAVAGAVPTSIQNGQPGRHAMHLLALRLPLENQIKFSAGLIGTAVTLTASGATGGTGLRLTNVLDGLHARVIQ